MEELFQGWFKDAEGNITAFQSMASKYLPIIIQVVITLVIIHFLMNGLKKGIKKSKIPRNIHTFTISGIRAILYFIVVIMVCGKLGIDITSLVAAFSIVGVAISLSIQNTLGNIMAGISILFTRQFNVDDYVEVDGISGTVTRVGLSALRLRTYDGKDIFVPNSNIIANKVINYTREPYRRVDITIGTSYSETVENVKRALQYVVDETPEVIKDKEIFVGITNFGESSIDYTIRVWVKSSEYWQAYLPMLEKIKRSFEKNNIEIPFNQLDVHLKQN